MYVVQRHSAVHLKAVLNRFQVNSGGENGAIKERHGAKEAARRMGSQLNSVTHFFLLFFGTE